MRSDERLYAKMSVVTHKRSLESLMTLLDIDVKKQREKLRENLIDN